MVPLPFQLTYFKVGFYYVCLFLDKKTKNQEDNNKMEETATDERKRARGSKHLKELLGEILNLDDGQDTDWDEVRERIQSHPEDTFDPFVADETKVYVLDVFLMIHEERKVPLDVINGIISANPWALITPPAYDRVFDTNMIVCPLSYITCTCCYHGKKSAALIRLIICATLDELVKCGDGPIVVRHFDDGGRHGFHPFSFIANGGLKKSLPHRRSHDEAVQIVLDEFPEILGPRAPSCLDVREIWHSMFYQWKNHDAAENDDGKLQSYWERTQTIVKVAHEQAYPGKKCSPLHVLIEKFVPIQDEDFWEIFCKLYYTYMPGRNVGCSHTRKAWHGILKQTLKFAPEQFSISNDEGDLPLHSFLKDRFRVLDPYNRDESQICSDMNAECLLQHFIDGYPEALGIADQDGSLPLALACRNFWPTNPFTLAEPRAIQTRNLVDHFYPFMSVRTSRANPYDKDAYLRVLEDLRALSECYKLIRSAPHLFAAFC